MNMKRYFATVALAAGLLLASGAFGQDVKPEDRNAALRYATIAYTTPADLFTKAGEADVSLAGFDLASAPEVFRAAVEAIKADSNDTVGQLIEASKLKKCDFEVATEQGVAALLPHLGKLRADARLLLVDARRLEMTGDADGAAERLAAMIRIARHAAGDRFIISSLVSMAICTLAIAEVDAAIDAGKLTPSARATVLAALNTLDKDDPFGVKPGIRGEQRGTLEWIKRSFRGDDAGRKLVATGYLDPALGGFMVSSPPQPTPAADAPGSKPPQANPAADAPKPKPPQASPVADAPKPKAQETTPDVESIAGMNEKELHAAADLASPVYDRLIAVWNDADAVDKLNTLTKDVEQGKYGPIGKTFAPGGTRLYGSTMKAQKLVTDIKLKLAASK